MGEVDAAATIKALGALQDRLERATRDIVARAAHMVQASAMQFAPVGQSGNSTNAPGDLRRSIRVDGPHGGDGYYRARVGPTVVYGRLREMGPDFGPGYIYPKVAHMLHFFRFGQEVFASRVYQVPHPYMKPARAAMIRPIKTMAYATWAAAVEGA